MPYHYATKVLNHRKLIARIPAHVDRHLQWTWYLLLNPHCFKSKILILIVLTDCIIIVSVRAVLGYESKFAIAAGDTTRMTITGQRLDSTIHALNVWPPLLFAWLQIVLCYESIFISCLSYGCYICGVFTRAGFCVNTLSAICDCDFRGILSVSYTSNYFLTEYKV